MRLELPVGGIASARFGVAPLFEVAALTLRLQRGTRGAVAGGQWERWRAALSGVADDDNVRLVLQLLTARHGSSVWVAGVPSMSRTFADDLDDVLSLPDSQLAGELTRYAAMTVSTEHADDHGRVEAGLRTLWDALLKQSWPSVRAVAEHEVARVTDVLRTAGWAAVFDQICDGVSWDGESLELTGIPTTQAKTAELVLVPSVFVAAGPVVRLGRDQPTVVYFPARGVGSLFETRAGDAPGLDALIGPNRALILQLLHQPTSVSRLRDLLGLSLGSVSRHLSILTGSGLVHSRRVGRTVEYELTALGRALVMAHPSGGE